MEKITVLSLFPQMILGALSYGILKRAENILVIESLNLRDWAKDQRVDDKSVAPGPGMLFRADVVSHAIKQNTNKQTYVIHMSPRGNVLNTQKIHELNQHKHLMIIASRYEGMDQRVLDHYIDEEISIGDYVLSGGELPALVLIDSLLRTDGHILRSDATEDESFCQGLLEYSHYTKPDSFENKQIPAYLKSGNHRLIQENRFLEQLLITWQRRPELLREYPLCFIPTQYSNPLKKIKKQNKLLQKRLSAFEKAIQENRNVRRVKNNY
ncbi:MAG: tRNA (guanosine(37)-N1)-methyltransferase TrmD [Brevinema sp.]